MAQVNNFEKGYRANNTKMRFSPEANIQYTVESEKDLMDDLDQLTEMLKHHEEHQRPRLDILDDYYAGENTAISTPNRRKEKDKADHRARHNFAGYVSDFMQGFFVGVPIAVEHTEKAAQGKIDEINETLEADALNADIVLDLSIYGRAYELLHRNQEDEVKSYLSSPLETFLIYDNTVEKNIIAGVRYFLVGLGDDQRIKVQLYTDNKIITYFTSNLGDYTLKFDSETDHSFGEVPINEYANNRFRKGDFEKVLDLIDLYDAGQSDTGNYMTDLNDALLAIIGNVELGIEEAKGMKDANILLAKPGQNADGRESNISADYIYKKYDVNGTEAYKDRLQTDIHKFTFTPDLNDENFAGQQTGEAAKYKLFGLEQIRINKERMMKRALNRRYKLINNIMQVASEASAGEFDGLLYQFTPNLPKNIKEQVDIFNSLGGKLSNETMLGLLPYEIDVEAEKELIAAERKQNHQTSSYMDVDS